MKHISQIQEENMIWKFQKENSQAALHFERSSGKGIPSNVTNS
jgi:hypothetical protein